LTRRASVSSLIVTVFHEEYACAGFETKNIPPVITDVDTTIAVIKAMAVVEFIVLQKYCNYHTHIQVKIFLLSFHLNKICDKNDR